MTRPPLLFSTYYRTYPLSQMGVFKRCIRLMPHLLDHFEIHVIHYGPLPEKEPLFAALRERLVIHDTQGDAGPLLHGVMEKVKPRALILGEAPLRGAMRMAHRVARRLRIPQIGIDNFYSEQIDRHYVSEWPGLDRWLLLGLLEDGVTTERPSPKCVVVPPLVRFPPDFASLARDRIVILGYDPATLASGLSLLGLLPRGQRVDFLVSPESRTLLEKHDLGFEHRILELPTDAAMYDSLTRARLVFGKAGYQQVVETLLLGAPILVRACGGGIVDELVATHLKPYVRIMKHDIELPKMAEDASRWLEQPPRLRWASLGASVPDTTTFAANVLRQLIEESAQPGEADSVAMQAEVLVPLWVSQHETAPLIDLKQMIEQRLWNDLRKRMGKGATVWLFDRAAGAGELIDLLRALLDDAVDVKLITMAHKCTEKRDGLTHFSRTCTLIWGERLSWKEHEVDFDLHLGARRGRGRDWNIAYIGATSPTPENVGSGA